MFGIGSARWPDGPPQSGVALGFDLIPVSGVGEAIGGVSEKASDEKIGGNGVEGAFSKDMTNDEMTAFGEVLSVHSPSRSWQLPLSGREPARKKKNLRSAQDYKRSPDSGELDNN